jgi:hypothetical protein
MNKANLQQMETAQGTTMKYPAQRQQAVYQYRPGWEI